MANTYSQILMHVVFSTKNRQPFLTADIRARLYPYMAGIAKQNSFKLLNIGGTFDHMHLLLSLHPTISVSKAVQLIKGGSSKWVHETFLIKAFAWQEGYGAFSVSVSGIDKTKEYIENQEEHHRKMSFQEEYLQFLKKNGIDFDVAYVFG